MDNLNLKESKNTQGGRIIELILKTIGIFGGIVVLWWFLGLVIMMGNFMGWIPSSFYNAVEFYMIFL